MNGNRLVQVELEPVVLDCFVFYRRIAPVYIADIDRWEDEGGKYA